jgi:hypothetical protein
MLEKARRAKGDRRCWLKAARRRDILGVEVRRLAVGVDILGDLFVCGVYTGRQEKGKLCCYLPIISHATVMLRGSEVEAMLILHVAMLG